MRMWVMAMGVDNIMLNDLIRDQLNNDAAENLDGGGYLNVNRGVFVPKASAFDYAMEQCVERGIEHVRKAEFTKEFRDMLIEWFYSGSEWREEK